VTKIAYLHNLPLEYYPPATNFLDMLSRSRQAMVKAFTTHNRKGREPYTNGSIDVQRRRPPNPSAVPFLRMLQALWWHVRTSWALLRFRPDAVIYVEPHSAIAAWIYFRLFGGSARLFIHHHEYYEQRDYGRPGMRIPRLGFARASWISQTNADRLRLAVQDNPAVSPEAWHTLANYPPAEWARWDEKPEPVSRHARLRLIYIGSASFEDTYIREAVEWAAAHSDAVELHVCGYNVADSIWEWLETARFPNVSFDKDGYSYDDLPAVLAGFDVGLVLYKGNTTNFIYNVPNKAFEYLVCGLEVWYPVEMKGMRNFARGNPAPLRELDFAGLHALQPEELVPLDNSENRGCTFTAQRSFAPLFEMLGLQAP
jgi:hypothetical protein